MSQTDQNAKTFEAAAGLWERMQLPEFTVDGYLDGSERTWNVPQVLRVAAERLRQNETACRD